MKRTIRYSKFKTQIKKRSWFIGLLILNFQIAIGQASMQPLFEEGNEAYNQGAYSEAIALYEQTITMGQHSAELYYNLANAYYRLNRVAESIFYFEKAQQLDPDNENIKINSSFAQNMTIDAIEPLPKSQLHAIKSQLFARMSLQSWSLFSVVMIWIFAFLFLAYLFLTLPQLKRIFFFLSLVSLFLFLGSFTIAFQLDQEKKNTEYGILFSQQGDVWSEPNQRGEIQFVLHEGTKMQLLDMLDEWQKIRIANGSEGWIKNAEIRSLKD
jgi:tetratricopeptide (TPR) repeat protein